MKDAIVLWREGFVCSLRFSLFKKTWNISLPETNSSQPGTWPMGRNQKQKVERLPSTHFSGANLLVSGRVQYLKSRWHSPYILVYKDPLLTYLSVSVPSILTLRYYLPESWDFKTLRFEGPNFFLGLYMLYVLFLFNYRIEDPGPSNMGRLSTPLQAVIVWRQNVGLDHGCSTTAQPKESQGDFFSKVPFSIAMWVYPSQKFILKPSFVQVILVHFQGCNLTKSWWFQLSTNLKSMTVVKLDHFQVVVKIESLWNHHLVFCWMCILATLQWANRIPTKALLKMIYRFPRNKQHLHVFIKSSQSTRTIKQSSAVGSWLSHSCIW